MRALGMTFLALLLSGCATGQYRPPPLDETARFEACEARIYDYWENRGLQDHGNRYYYFGASGRAQQAQVRDECGPRPLGRSARGPALSSGDCNDLYINIYLSCLGNASFLRSGVAESYFLAFDDSVLDPADFASLCSKGTRVSREDFGVLMCGE